MQVVPEEITLLAIRHNVLRCAGRPITAELLCTSESLHRRALLCRGTNVRLHLQKASTRGAHPAGTAMDSILVSNQLVEKGNSASHNLQQCSEFGTGAASQASRRLIRAGIAEWPGGPGWHGLLTHAGLPTRKSIHT